MQLMVWWKGLTDRSVARVGDEIAGKQPAPRHRLHRWNTWSSDYSERGLGCFCTTSGQTSKTDAVNQMMKNKYWYQHACRISCEFCALK